MQWRRRDTWLPFRPGSGRNRNCRCPRSAWVAACGQPNRQPSRRHSALSSLKRLISEVHHGSPWQALPFRAAVGFQFLVFLDLTSSADSRSLGHWFGYLLFAAIPATVLFVGAILLSGG